MIKKHVQTVEPRFLWLKITRRCISSCNGYIFQRRYCTVQEILACVCQSSSNLHQQYIFRLGLTMQCNLCVQETGQRQRRSRHPLLSTLVWKHFKDFGGRPIVIQFLNDISYCKRNQVTTGLLITTLAVCCRPAPRGITNTPYCNSWGLAAVEIRAKLKINSKMFNKGGISASRDVQ